MYADVQERYPGGAARLEDELRQAAAAVAVSNASHARSSVASQSLAAGSAGTVHTSDASSHEPLARPQGAALAVNTSFSTGASTVPTSHDKRFLLPIVNSKTVRVLSQPELPDSDDDQEFFNRIRLAYLEVRTSRPPVFRRGTPLLVQKAVEQLHRLSIASQSLFIRVFEFLHLDWLIWWIGDIVFFIPTAANFVKVRLSITWSSSFSQTSVRTCLRIPVYRLTDCSLSWYPSRRIFALRS